MSSHLRALSALCLLCLVAPGVGCDLRSSGQLGVRAFHATCVDQRDCQKGQLCVERQCVAASGEPGGGDAGTAPGVCVPFIARACYGPGVPPPLGSKCEPGYEICRGNGTWGPCIGAPDVKGEVCDGKDNDCDGLIDNLKKGVCEGAELVVSPGSFLMGSPNTEALRQKTEGPVHRVTLTYPFAMFRYEVTQKLYQSLVGRNPSYFKSCGDTCPVENLTWHEALAFLNALSRKYSLPECFVCYQVEGHTRCALREQYESSDGSGYFACLGYRLPSEAEWEYVARAGSSGPLYDGAKANATGCQQDANLSALGWYCGNAEVTYKGCHQHETRSACLGTHPIGLKRPNAWGFHDMLGNVAEWLYDKRYGSASEDASAYPSSSRTNPLFLQFGSGGSHRFIRGGTWWHGVGALRTAARLAHETKSRFFGLGLRPVRSFP